MSSPQHHQGVAVSTPGLCLRLLGRWKHVLNDQKSTLIKLGDCTAHAFPVHRVCLLGPKSDSMLGSQRRTVPEFMM